MIVAAKPVSWPINGWQSSDVASSASGATLGFGINVSEPVYSASNYYPGGELDRAAPKGPNNENEWYGDPTELASPPAYFPGPPLEVNRGDNGPPASLGFDGLSANRPLVWDTNNSVVGAVNMLQTGTTINYKTLYLQRIANPLMPYNPVTNPYLTVDWLPVDLTVYNGDDSHQWTPANMTKVTWMNTPPATGGGLAPYVPWDPDDPVMATDASATSAVYQPGRQVVFVSRQRGGNYANAAKFSGAMTTPAYYNLWAQAVANQAATGTDPLVPKRLDPTDPWYMATSAGTSAILPGNTSNFPYDLNSTLGGLNIAFSISGSIGTGPYAGGATYPFPWIAWNNRPYANAMELLMVPSSHPGRLMWEFQFLPQGTSSVAVQQCDGVGRGCGLQS